MRMPRVSGRSVSALKYLMVWGWPSSNTSKLSLLRLGMSAPRLSLTLKNNWTTSTLTFSVPTDWSWDWSLDWSLDWPLEPEPGGAVAFWPDTGNDRIMARANQT